MFRHFGFLIAWDIFDNISESFLPIGHTQEDVDQLFFVHIATT